ncbi:MAG: transcription antitermination factor NusB [Salinisphaera sp.]|nr:transcription antitermination factor NusB [Salinisphaera sp.]MDN5937454.1 transcription antitermination factor NusB [Salinisphaera sp.]
MTEPVTDNPPRAGARRGARRAALQAIYQWLAAGTETGDLVLQFQRSELMRGADGDYFTTLVRGVLAQPQRYEERFAAYLDRAPGLLDPVERAILLLAVFELCECPQVPYRVVLNEAVELAKAYGAEASHRYINAVLDAAAGALRPLEASPDRG